MHEYVGDTSPRFKKSGLKLCIFDFGDVREQLTQGVASGEDYGGDVAHVRKEELRDLVVPVAVHLSEGVEYKVKSERLCTEENIINDAGGFGKEETTFEI